MTITYKINHPITTDQFIDLLNASTLGQRRPTENRDCMTGMLQQADLTITAWHEEQLVGIARAVTDFHYCCYLSDLAVEERHQRQGIGKQLVTEIQRQLQPTCSLILLSAPAAVDYYPRIGFKKHPQAWLLTNKKKKPKIP
ncbi:MAG TPA: GNAT family N-acetyltransferase [Candidatus Tenderia sp.]|nr:GNAT family N-acetyltransferase [Candidatus Tenderia sp.]